MQPESAIARFPSMLSVALPEEAPIPRALTKVRLRVQVRGLPQTRLADATQFEDVCLTNIMLDAADQSRLR